jgi:uncharacterized RDD family membrane protein YckC
VGSRVTGARREGRKGGIDQGFGRNLLRIIDGLPLFDILGIVLIATSAENARFGDLIAGTRVIR